MISLEKVTAVFAGAFLLALFSVSGQERPVTPAARPAVRSQARMPSPEIHPDNRVTFRLYSRNAAAVTVSGEWQTGSQAMTKSDSGFFTITVGPLKPELYSYSFTVDGLRITDPSNIQVRRDGSRYESWFIVPGPGSDLYLHKHDVPHGTVSKVWYRSAVLGMDRRMYVYTPPGYESGKGKYPVFYLLHGAGGDEDAWTNMGRTAQIIDNLIARGRAKPMIVVMTNGNANQAGAQNDVPPIPAQEMQSLEAYSRFPGSFEEHLVKDVVTYIEDNYRIKANAASRAIAGLSMGGAHTQTITFDNPTMFGYIGVFSMGLMDLRQRNQDVSQLEGERQAKLEALAKSGYKLYWIGCGKDDFLYQSVVNLRGFLDRNNFRYVYRESEGGHTWTNWRIYLSEFAPLLFK
ncbi:MAG: alpha/beta hydrolase-fold protein [Bacteroidales bacterium]|jgi:enterochelin esterase family protein|nr:alpha/beta hydrolase-fold protein [Bacteroidales bacterium]